MLFGSPADAQQSGSKRQHQAGPDEPGSQNPVLFSADEVTYDDQLEIAIARGNVELSQSGRTLLADVVSYNQRTDTVTASGNVSLIEDATGQTTFANYVELQDNMRNGFIKDFRMLLADRSRLAANTGRRTDGNRTELRNGVYSPCDLCKTDPSAPPLWQLSASTIVHNKAEQVVEYEDATLDLDGYPVLWSPYFSHPDPTVKRQSGFLPIVIGTNSLLGFYTAIPYYWVLGPDKDLTIKPIFTETQNTVLDGEYRQRFNNGLIDIAGSVTDSDPNVGGIAGNQDNQVRGHLFAIGTFDIDDNLRAGFNIQRTSDIEYLPEYKLEGAQNFLNSSIFLEDFQGRDYGSIYAYDFQSLELTVPDRTQPIVFPVADYTWASRPMSFGGRFTTSVDVLDLIRETGATEKRLSAGTEFDLPFDGSWGQKFNFVAAARADGYYVTAQPLIFDGAPAQGLTGRFFPQVGLEWRYPWLLRDDATSWLIEPKVAFYAAPIGMNPAKIPDIDSAAISFNDTDLFTRNRFVGYDQVDGGQRVDYGIHGQWLDQNQTVDALIGQSYRFQQSSPFNVDGTGDGLQHQTSDYVGRITVTPADWLDLGYHFRFDEHSLQPELQEVITTFGPQSVRFGLNYYQVGDNVRDGETPRQQLGAMINIRATDYWTVTMNGTRDLSGDTHLLSAGAYLRYSDECTTFISSISESGEVIGNLHPGTTILFTLILKNLGEIAAPIETGFSAS